MKTYDLIDSNGNLYLNITSINGFCMYRGLDVGKMLDLVDGKIEEYRGFRLYYESEEE